MLGFFCLLFLNVIKRNIMQLSEKFGFKLAFFISIFFLVACTQKFKDTFSTVNASIEGLADVELSKEELKEFPYDSAYVSLNDSRRILMVLALIEENYLNNSQRLKWVSADNFMLITENGRIVKTLGFDDNLMTITSEGNLASNIPPPSIQSNTWLAYYDWMPSYRYQFTAEISSSLDLQEVISLSSWSLNTQHIEENINFPDLNSAFTNHYWLNQNGKVVKTIQYLGPNMDKIEMSFVKDFLPK